MSKEAARINRLIQQNGQTIFITKVDLNNIKEITSCVQKIVQRFPDIVVMISSATRDNRLISAAHVKSIPGFLPQTVEATGIPSTNTFTKLDDIDIAEISYSPESEQYAFKNVDILNGTAFAILKKAGLYEEESSEEEYGLDL